MEEEIWKPIDVLDGKYLISNYGNIKDAETGEHAKTVLNHGYYVVVTIGTNGGNTEETLSQLIEYIISVGSIPILNHIPCNESGTQVAVNALIDLIRAKYGIKGADFDLCTSLAGDGVNVNTDEMWWENYSSTQNVYHHPNVKGSTAMLAQALRDIPEIFG